MATRPNIKRIAELSKSSITAVSLILNGRPHRYSEETCRRVIETARKHGYSPNASARMMRSGRTENVTLVVSNVPGETSLFLPFEIGAHNALHAAGLHLSLAYLDCSEEASDDMLERLLKEWRADGLILTYQRGAPAALRSYLDRFSVPAISANLKKRYDAVYPKDRESARSATRALLDLGHRRILYLGPDSKPPLHFSRADRLAGYTQAMENAGASPEVALVSQPVHGPEAVRPLLARRRNRPTAVLCYSSQHAHDTLGVAWQAGLQVPRDLSVLTFANNGDTQLGGISISHLSIPWHRMGEAAVELLLKKIEQPGKALVSTAFDMPVRLLDSTAPPKK